VFAKDENDDLLVLNSVDKKIYTTAVSEAVDISMKTKTFAISNDRPEVIRNIAITYKSAAALTFKIYSAENIASGNIEVDVTYTVQGYTTVTYNGTDYHGATNDTFTGVAGKMTYTTTGTGTVQQIKTETIPVSATWRVFEFSPRYRAKKFIIEVVDTVDSTTATEIGNITVSYD
jgi:hypothetical protein